MASSIVVASGKGGVWQDQRCGQSRPDAGTPGARTILLDADFGMANAHILIGANPQRLRHGCDPGRCQHGRCAV